MSNKNKKNKVKAPPIYQMTKGEQMNLAGREGMRSQMEYMVHVIQMDMDKYVDDVIKPRFVDLVGKKTLYDVDRGIIQLIEEPKVKVNEEVNPNGKSNK